MIRFVFRAYKLIFSFLLKYIFGGGCRFQPTCSEYSKLAFDKYGPVRGTLLTLRRISKCHPLGPSGYDPVP